MPTKPISLLDGNLEDGRSKNRLRCVELVTSVCGQFLYLQMSDRCLEKTFIFSFDTWRNKIFFIPLDISDRHQYQHRLQMVKGKNILYSTLKELVPGQRCGPPSGVVKFSIYEHCINFEKMEVRSEKTEQRTESNQFKPHISRLESRCCTNSELFITSPMFYSHAHIYRYNLETKTLTLRKTASFHKPIKLLQGKVHPWLPKMIALFHHDFEPGTPLFCAEEILVIDLQNHQHKYESEIVPTKPDPDYLWPWIRYNEYHSSLDICMNIWNDWLFVYDANNAIWRLNLSDLRWRRTQFHLPCALYNTFMEILPSGRAFLCGKQENTIEHFQPKNYRIFTFWVDVPSLKNLAGDVLRQEFKLDPQQLLHAPKRNGALVLPVQ